MRSRFLLIVAATASVACAFVSPPDHAPCWPWSSRSLARSLGGGDRTEPETTIDRRAAFAGAARWGGGAAVTISGGGLLPGPDAARAAMTPDEVSARQAELRAVLNEATMQAAAAASAAASAVSDIAAAPETQAAVAAAGETVRSLASDAGTAAGAAGSSLATKIASGDVLTDAQRTIDDTGALLSLPKMIADAVATADASAAADGAPDPAKVAAAISEVRFKNIDPTRAGRRRRGRCAPSWLTDL